MKKLGPTATTRCSVVGAGTVAAKWKRQVCCQTSRGRREEGGGVGNWVALALNSKGEGWTGSRREINELAEAETNYRVGRIS